MRTHVVSSGTLTLPCTSLFYHSYPFGLWPGRHAAQQDLSQRPDVIRQVEELMEERGVELDHATIHRWVLKYSLQLEEEFHLRKRPVGCRWRMDETYIRVKGEWRYLYRAVDTSGQTIDVLLTEHRDTAAALRFLTQAIRRHGVPS